MRTEVKMKHLIALFIAVSMSLSPAYSQKLGIGVRVGSQGVGADLSLALTSFLNVRAGGTSFSIALPEATIEDENVDVAFTGDASLMTASLLADLFPFRNGIRLTAGATYNNSSISTTGSPTDSYSVQSRTFTTQQIGSLTAELGYGSSIQPYVGIGFGNPARGGRIGLLFDAGVLLSGPPELTMSGTGMIAPTATENQETIQEALDGIEIFPVLSLGLSVRL